MRLVESAFHQGIPDIESMHWRLKTVTCEQPDLAMLNKIHHCYHCLLRLCSSVLYAVYHIHRDSASSHADKSHQLTSPAHQLSV